MNDLSKTKEELIKELQELRQENNSLKEYCQKDITNQQLSEAAFQKSEYYYRSLYDNMLNGFAYCKMDYVNDEPDDFTYIFVNQAFENLTGLKDVEDKKVSEVIPGVKKDDNSLFKIYGRVALNGISEKFEYYLESLDMWFLVSVYSPKKEYFVALFDVITERKKAEEKLKRIETELKRSQQLTHIGSFNIDLKTNLVTWSEELYKIYGFDPSHSIPLLNESQKLLTPESWERLSSSIANTAETGVPYEIELVTIRKDDSNGWIWARGEATINTKGEISGVWGTVQDITERKHIEEELIVAKEKAEENEAQFRQIFENSIDSIMWTEAQTGLIIACNPASQFLTEYSKQELLGQSITLIIPTEKSRKIMSDYQLHQQSKITKSLEFQIITKSGIIKDVELSGTNIEINGKEISQGILKDITYRKQKELEVLLAKERAEESDKLKSAFLANMSHEIRTPMNGILGFANLLKDSRLSGEEQQEYICIIEKSGTRMLNIINDIVDISKIESGQIKVNIGDSNVNEQIEYLYTFFKPEAEQKGMRLLSKTSLLARKSVIQTDREKVFAILTNLLKNAIKYSDTGTIEFGYNLKIDRESAELEFFVQDQGIGIPKDRQEAVFERFIQADISDKRAFQGAGLGLAITKSYVEMLGGKIWVESEEGIGSTFYFTLPYNSKFKEKIILESNVPWDERLNLNKTLKILIAEDDEDSEILLSILVKKFSKEVLKVKNGIDAIEACRNNPDIDLVLMDIQMPKMNGYEATRQIRQFNENIVIIAQTAFGLDRDKDKAIDAGCNDYISKPMNTDKFIMLIQKYFDI